MRPKRIHVWTPPAANGGQQCVNCGATRAVNLGGWKKTPAMLNGKRAPFCKAKPKPNAPPAVSAGVPAKPSPALPPLTMSAMKDLREP